MIKPTRYLFLLILLFPFIQCTKTGSSSRSLTGEINEFIWKGMNTYYLWQDSVPDLSDTRFSSQSELADFAELYDAPDEFFEHLIWKRGEVDKWSWIVDDYEALEAYFSGIRKTTGAKIKLYRMAENSSSLFGIVRYIIPGTDAAGKPIQRGDIFASVNGVSLTISNYKDLLVGAESYTLDLGDYQYNPQTQSVEITPNDQHITLVKGEYPENPVFIKTVFDTAAGKVGYLMYNSFTANYDQELNDAFAYFQSEGISDLILDLRYNGGGSVRTAIYLSGMITGQFEGQVFTREIWNTKMNQWLAENHPEWAVNLFTNQMHDGTTLNNLHLNRLLVITTADSASASELVINALRPYIEVLTIGSTTHGKYAASITLYDSPDFTKDNINDRHRWAIQPIVLKEVNATNYYAPEGFPPYISLPENPQNFGILGDENEPLLQAALNYLINGDTRIQTIEQNRLSPVNQPFSPMEKEMYIQKQLPNELL